MQRLENYKTILWDFDGVLINSLPVRDRGFREVLKGYPQDEIEQLVAYHEHNGGLSRYVKFRHFYEEIRKEEATEEKIDHLAKRFSKIMLDFLIDPRLLREGPINFVKENFKNYNFHIVSGSDGVELNKICKGLSLDGYFITIEGSPTPKNQLVKDILKKYGYDPKDTCLIGDSINDAEAAKVNEIGFFGYNNPKLKTDSNAYIDSFQ